MCVCFWDIEWDVDMRCNVQFVIKIVPYSIVLVPHVRIIKYKEHCRNMHSIRANCHLSLNMDVHKWRHDLVEVGHTFTLD